MYRIISGTLKGRKIIAPNTFTIRPTTDFAKEGLFSSLSHDFNYHDLVILDLFGGIGSISLEFLSRGCQNITIVENNFKHYKFIETQINHLDLSSSVHLVKQDVFSFLKHCSQAFDIIFADPPFDFKLEDYNRLIDLILTQKLIKEAGYFILEHSSKINFNNYPNFIKSKKYGNITFSFFNS